MRSENFASRLLTLKPDALKPTAGASKPLGFPKSKYTGGDWDAVERDMRKIWTEAHSERQLLKLSIFSPWEERNEAFWRADNVWVSATYRYIDAFFLAKLSNGEHYYYLSTFRQKRLSKGNWSELRYHGAGQGNKILSENIDK